MAEKGSKWYIYAFIACSALVFIYPYVRIISLAGSRVAPEGILLSLILSLLYIPTHFLCRKFPNILVRTIYILEHMLLGTMFIAFWTAIFVDILKFIFRFPDVAAFGAIVIITGIVSAFAVINGKIIRTRHLTIKLRGIKRPFSFAFASDLHIGAIHGKSYLKRAVRILNSLNADIVLVAGDIYDGSVEASPEIIKHLKKLHRPCFASTGNHEFYEGLDRTAGFLSEARVKVLRNECVPYKEIQIAGIDYTEKPREVQEAISKMAIDGRAPLIILNHVPVGFELVNGRPGILMMSGHTHAGQIFPFGIITRLFYRHNTGTYYSKGSYIHVSSGAGTWGPPMRLGSSNEILLVRLVPG